MARKTLASPSKSIDLEVRYVYGGSRWDWEALCPVCWKVARPIVGLWKIHLAWPDYESNIQATLWTCSDECRARIENGGSFTILPAPAEVGLAIQNAFHGGELRVPDFTSAPDAR